MVKTLDWNQIVLSNPLLIMEHHLSMEKGLRQSAHMFLSYCYYQNCKGKLHREVVPVAFQNTTVLLREKWPCDDISTLIIALRMGFKGQYWDPEKQSNSQWNQSFQAMLSTEGGNCLAFCLHCISSPEFYLWHYQSCVFQQDEIFKIYAVKKKFQNKPKLSCCERKSVRRDSDSAKAWSYFWLGIWQTPPPWEMENRRLQELKA